MIPPLAIGDLKLSAPLLLAPMAGYSDYAFREGARALGGIGLAFTEMLNPRSVLSGRGLKRAALLAHGAEDHPLGWQIYGSDPILLADCAQYLRENRQAELIDINMGCPQRKIVRRGEGAALLKNPGLAARVASAVVAAVNVPVTVKLRIGWDNERLEAANLAAECSARGVKAVTVHGRTGVQKFNGSADLGAIAEVVRAAGEIPVIGNGDINTPLEASKMLERTGCAGIMIGRAALRNPWIFKQTLQYLDCGNPVKEPDRRQRREFMLSHLERSTALYGFENGAKLFRKWIPQYAQALGIGKPAMVELLRISQTETLRKALQAV